LDSKVSCSICSICLTSMRLACGHASPNMMEHLPGLISYPVLDAYVSSISLTLWACNSCALKNSKLSSANKR
jgi:hypothetical protein